MSRIRSIHPGLWTDERFMEVSPLARLLQIGIWNECDDKGSFEWSPIKLKARLLPVDNCDINELLGELVRAGSVIAYEIQGRKLGAVRNFTRYQRPKKPNDIYPQTDEVRNYCSGERTEVPNRFPTDGENDAQMEEGGGSSEADASGADDAQDPESAEPEVIDPAKLVFDAGIALLGQAGIAPGKARPILGKWRQAHGDEAVIAALGTAKREGAIDPVSFIEACLRGVRNGNRHGSGDADGARGNRPNPALDLWRAGVSGSDDEDEDSGEDHGNGGRAWPSLPAGRER